MNHASIATEASREVVAWINAEVTRFAPSMMGSTAVAGLLHVQQIYDSADAQGFLIEKELDRIGCNGKGLGDSPVGAHL